MKEIISNKVNMNTAMKPDNKTAAICGLFCGTCPSYPDSCHGCLSDKLTAHCVTCPNGFRDCAKEHNAIRCSECDEFPCSRLDDFSKKHYENGIGHHESVISDLSYMKNNGVEEWVETKIQENTCSKCGQLIYWYDKNNHKCNNE